MSASSRPTWAAPMSEPLLRVESLVAGYDDLQVLHGVDLTVAAEERVLLFGPNGSGKSTLLKAVCGLARVFSGSVSFDGDELADLPAERVVARGISYVPQVDNVFPSLTVAENLEIGGVLNRGATRDRIAEVYDLFPVLAERRSQSAGTLSGGERQLVALGRALMLRPQLLLLDEPSAGLAPRLVDETFRHVLRINEEWGTAILLVEQNVRQALPVVSRAYLMETGAVRLEGSAERIGRSHEVSAAYLGLGASPTASPVTEREEPGPPTLPGGHGSTGT